MKWLIVLTLSLFQVMHSVQAMVYQHHLGNNFRLLSIKSDTYLKRPAGLYSLNISHHGKNVGVVRDFYFSTRWRTGLGFLIADEYIEIDTGRSEIRIANRSIDLNRYLGIHAEIRFFEIMPFASIAYQYQNDEKDMVFDFIAGLKLLKLDDGGIYFDKQLGMMLESFPDVSSRLKEEMLDSLQQYYLLPVIDFRFKYSFN